MLRKRKKKKGNERKKERKLLFFFTPRHPVAEQARDIDGNFIDADDDVFIDNFQLRINFAGDFRQNTACTRRF